ncbi:MAG: hypothetical protein WA372_08665, partial [Candidatus Sulfotelmatobacter sp.]
GWRTRSDSALDRRLRSWSDVEIVVQLPNLEPRLALNSLGVYRTIVSLSVAAAGIGMPLPWFRDVTRIERFNDRINA